MTDLHDLTEQLNLIASDPALLDSFRRKNPAFVDLCRVIIPPSEPTVPVIGFPAISSMTAIQAAIFDNWPQARRVDRQPNRYAITFEIWTMEGDRIDLKKLNHQHKATAALMDQMALLKWLKTRLKENPKKMDEYRLSEEFLSDLLDLSGDMRDGDYVGLFAHKTKGTRFFDRQMVHVQLDGQNTRAIFFVEGVPLVLPTFSSFKPNSTDRLGGNVILQSRADLCGFSSAWATEEHSEEGYR